MKQAVMDMINAICDEQNVTREEIAAVVGKTVQQFNNCLYQTNGQQFKTYDLIAIQNRYEVTGFTDWVCEQTGGVFVAAKEKAELDKIELFELMVAEQNAVAALTSYFAKALEDGVITAGEYKKMQKKHMKVFQARSNRLEATYKVYGGEEK